MQRFLLFSLLTFLFACSQPMEPTFKEITSIEVEEIKGGNVTIAAEALYHNPNSLGGNLDGILIDVWANDNNIGKIDQELDVEIEANSEFTIPLVITFPLSELTKDQGSLLGGLLKAVLDKKVDMEYKGNLKLSLAGIPFKVPVEVEEEVIIK